MKGVCDNIGSVPSFSTFCSSFSVTVIPTFCASASITRFVIICCQTWSLTWLSSVSDKLSRCIVNLIASWYSSTNFWKSCTLIFSPKTSPTCCRASPLIPLQERKASSAINAKRPSPIITISVMPLLLIFPNAAIFIYLFLIYFFYRWKIAYKNTNKKIIKIINS